LLIFRDHRHDANRKPVSVRHIDGNEVDAGLLKAQKKVSVTRKAVQLGNDQLRTIGPAGLQGISEHRPIN
jgi:hypothetical protein